MYFKNIGTGQQQLLSRHVLENSKRRHHMYAWLPIRHRQYRVVHMVNIILIQAVSNVHGNLEPCQSTSSKDTLSLLPMCTEASTQSSLLVPEYLYKVVSLGVYKYQYQKAVSVSISVSMKTNNSQYHSRLPVFFQIEAIRLIKILWCSTDN